jgi:hypothetical protein
MSNQQPPIESLAGRDRADGSLPRPDPIETAVRGFYGALRTGDATELVRHCLPHPELARLLTHPAPATAAARLGADLASLTVRASELPRDRHLVQAWLGNHVQLLAVQATSGGHRVDARYQLAAQRPDDDVRAAARAFYRALVTGDLAALQAASFDARGVELLASERGAPVDRWEHDLQVQMLALVELGPGDPFEVPTGTQFMGSRHLELGIRVLHGLTQSGEIPFLLRPRDGHWKVLPFYFIQAIAAQRGATFGSA